MFSFLTYLLRGFQPAEEKVRAIKKTATDAWARWRRTLQGLIMIAVFLLMDSLGTCTCSVHPHVRGFPHRGKGLVPWDACVVGRAAPQGFSQRLGRREGWVRVRLRFIRTSWTWSCLMSVFDGFTIARLVVLTSCAVVFEMEDCGLPVKLLLGTQQGPAPRSNPVRWR